MGAVPFVLLGDQVAFVALPRTEGHPRAIDPDLKPRNPCCRNFSVFPSFVPLTHDGDAGYYACSLQFIAGSTGALRNNRILQQRLHRTDLSFNHAATLQIST